jgi:hypothetical protein
VPPQGMDGSADAVQAAHRSGDALFDARQLAREPRFWQRSGKQGTDSQGLQPKTGLNPDSPLGSQSRRDFLMSVSAAGAAAAFPSDTALADEGPSETTEIRLAFTTAICFAPFDVAETFLRTEGFTDIQYVRAAGGFSAPEMIARGEVDFGVSFAGTIVYYLDALADHRARRAACRLLRAVRARADQ